MFDVKPPDAPSPRVDFIGRESALQKLRSLLAEGRRVVSLTGAEGVGKSRLAAELVAGWGHALSNGAGCLHVDVTDAAGEEEVIERVAERLEVELPASADAELPDLVGELLSTRGALVVVLDGADRGAIFVRALVNRWLLLAPLARFLLTAREALGLTDEVRVRLGPLRTPPVGTIEPDEIRSYEAVRLFSERARAAVRGYAVEDGDAEAVAEIVRRLSGLPLAIELAASRAGAYSAQELLERLPTRVQHLKPGLRAGGARPRPRPAERLKSTIEWSWRLLEDWERATLAQSSVFRGGFSLSAAEAVLDLSPYEDAPPVEAALASVAVKSLLRRGEVRSPARERRFMHYTSVRHFAHDSLEQSGEAERVCNRHAAYYLALGQQLSGGIDGHGGLDQRRRLERETENLLAVVRGALAHDPVTAQHVTWALEGLLALEPVLSTRGPFSVHLSLLDAALEPAELLDIDPTLRARALESRGRLLRARGQLKDSLGDLEGALALARGVADKLLEGRALANIGTHHLLTGELEEAERRYGRAFELLRAAGARDIEARARLFHGKLRQRQGRTQEALSDYEQAVEALKQVGDRRYEGITLGEVANLLAEEGRLSRAARLYERALVVHREVGNRRYEATTLRELGSIRLEEGKRPEARALLEKAAVELREVFDRPGEARACTRLGDLFVEMRNFDEARRWYDRALVLQPTEVDRSRLALLLARLGALDGRDGAAELARGALAEARALATGDGDPAVLDVLSSFEVLLRGTPAHGAIADDEEDDEVTQPMSTAGAHPQASPHLRAELRAARTVTQALRGRGG